MKSHLLQLSYSIETIGIAAKQFREALFGYHLFAFSGEMGAGKTTFIHYLCDELGVEDAVSSPTFALINEYHFYDALNEDNIIFHLDWYRLKNEEEAINAGMEDCVEQAQNGLAVCFIEWPEKAPGLLRKPYLWIDLETTGMTERKMDVYLYS